MRAVDGVGGAVVDTGAEAVVVVVEVVVAWQSTIKAMGVTRVL